MRLAKLQQSILQKFKCLTEVSLILILNKFSITEAIFFTPSTLILGGDFFTSAIKTIYKMMVQIKVKTSHGNLRLQNEMEKRLL